MNAPGACGCTTDADCGMGKKCDLIFQRCVAM
jgi:hypothetical protein